MAAGGDYGDARQFHNSFGADQAPMAGCGRLEPIAATAVETLDRLRVRLFDGDFRLRAGIKV